MLSLIKVFIIAIMMKPLIVPEVNLDALPNYKNEYYRQSNCNTIPIAVGLKPIYDAVGIDRINVSTYQSVSGTGKEAITELTEQTRLLLDNQKIQPKVYSQQLLLMLPHIDDFQDNGYTREEMKVVWEMRKILMIDACHQSNCCTRTCILWPCCFCA